METTTLMQTTFQGIFMCYAQEKAENSTQA